MRIQTQIHANQHEPPTQCSGPPSPELQLPPPVKTFGHALFVGGQVADLDHLPSPRLFHAHIPFHMLPTTSSNCKLVFICRNPGDNFISSWKFFNKILSTAGTDTELSLEEAFDLFCNGRYGYGPYWDSVLGYWQASKQEPERVLFFHYQELKQEPAPQVKKLASFLGVPFTEEEEEEGVVEDIIDLYSFDKMRNLEVNKTGK